MTNTKIWYYRTSQKHL